VGEQLLNDFVFEYQFRTFQRYNPFYQDMMRKEGALEFAEIGYDSDNEEGRQYLSDLKNNKIEYFRDNRDYEKSAKHLEKVYRKMKRQDAGIPAPRPVDHGR
jgi:hypothetical protein